MRGFFSFSCLLEHTFIHSFILPFFSQKQIAYEKLCQQVSKLEEVRHSEINLMRHRINDLTVKLTSTEKSLRQTQHKLMKCQAKTRKMTSCEESGSLQSLVRQETTPQPLEHDINKTQQENREEELTSNLMNNLFVVVDSDQNDKMLTRLHDLSSSVRKMSESLNSFCDTTTKHFLTRPSVCLESSFVEEESSKL